MSAAQRLLCCPDVARALVSWRQRLARGLAVSFALACAVAVAPSCQSSPDRFGAVAPSDAGTWTLTDADLDAARADASRPDAGRRCYSAKEPFGIDRDFGQSLPDISLLGCDGAVATLNELRCGNKVTLVSIGAGWCEPCEQEAVFMEELYQRYHSRGLEVVQLMYADREGFAPGVTFCRAWRDTFKLSYPVYVDPQGNTLQLFTIGVTPLNILVDKYGKVLWSGFGVLPEDIEGEILPYL